jgi:hypothetical protein
VEPVKCATGPPGRRDDCPVTPMTRTRITSPAARGPATRLTLDNQLSQLTGWRYLHANTVPYSGFLTARSPSLEGL